MDKQPNSRMCFVCGIDNPIGLHLSFYTDEEGCCVARLQPRPEHQGYPSHLHGGIVSTLIDMTVGRVLTAFGRLPALRVGSAAVHGGELYLRRSQGHCLEEPVAMANGWGQARVTVAWWKCPSIRGQIRGVTGERRGIAPL